ncbi:DUF1573 domain-containing protein [Thalassoroseus pseudoceratinae]|uniref:DUF1573 domain-containing protein n=1 Tax=Thalassoroseus pseudoceratinae TaxID=2713176 RepID=UPI00141FE10A|nr:DUF1573 domain-containing protein [Thalassoroseus pseudoceratinae]
MNFPTILAVILVGISAVAGIVAFTGGPVATEEVPVEEVSTDDPYDNHGLKIAKEPPYPKAALQEDAHHEFGVMNVGSTGSHTFIIKNEGEAPLQLKKGDTTCKCTLSELAENEIPPGETAEIKLEWTPKEPTSQFRQQADIHTNDPENKTIALNVIGAVDDFLHVVPESSWELPILGDDQPRSMEGLVYSTVLDDFNIQSIETPSDYLTAEWRILEEDELAQYNAKSGYEITVTAQPTMEVGKHSDLVTITTDVEERERLSMTVYTKRPGPVQAASYIPPGKSGAHLKWRPELPALNLGQFRSEDGQVGWYSLVVRGVKDDEELVVEDIEKVIPNFNPDDLEVEIKRDETANLPNAQRYLVTFRVKPGAKKGSHLMKESAKVTLKTNIKGLESYKFYIQFIVI